MKNISGRRQVMACVVLLALLSASFITQAQNLIANAGFENNPPTAFGNNIGHSISPWILGPGNTSNVVKVDGPGGFNYGDFGPQSDSSNNGGGAGAGVQQHYLDIAAGANDFYQAFPVPLCGPAPGQSRQVTFSGWFSTRDNLSGNGSITIRSGAGLTGTPLATVNVSLPAPASSATAPWVNASGSVTVQAGTTISYVVAMDNNLNFDEASLSFTNTPCITAPLTLQKSWQHAIVNDVAVLTADRGGSVVDSLTSIANSANETDTDATPLTVYQGESITLAESLPGSNVGTYATTLACTGGGTMSGNVLVVDSSGTPILCTWTNVGQTAGLSITKTSNTGTATSGGNTTYTIVATNNGPSPSNNAVVRDDWTTLPGLNCSAGPATCVASGTAGTQCPAAASVTPAALQAGLAIPVFPNGGIVTFTLQCAVTATGL